MLNIFPEFINNFLISTLQDVICTVCLVRRDKVAIKGSRKWNNSLKLVLELADQIRLENLRTFACVIEVVLGDVPTANNEFARLYQGDKFFHWFVHVTKGTCLFVVLKADMGSCALSEGTVEVSLDISILCLPRKLLLVGKDTSNKGGTVVATKTDEHDSELGNFLSGTDGVFFNYVLV